MDRTKEIWKDIIGGSNDGDINTEKPIGITEEGEVNTTEVNEVNPYYELIESEKRIAEERLKKQEDDMRKQKQWGTVIGNLASVLQNMINVEGVKRGAPSMQLTEPMNPLMKMWEENEQLHRKDYDNLQNILREYRLKGALYSQNKRDNAMEETRKLKLELSKDRYRNNLALKQQQEIYDLKKEEEEEEIKKEIENLKEIYPGESDNELRLYVTRGIKTKTMRDEDTRRNREDYKWQRNLENEYAVSEAMAKNRAAYNANVINYNNEKIFNLNDTGIAKRLHEILFGDIGNKSERIDEIKQEFINKGIPQFTDEEIEYILNNKELDNEYWEDHIGIIRDRDRNAEDDDEEYDVEDFFN